MVAGRTQSGERLTTGAAGVLRHRWFLPLTAGLLLALCGLLATRYEVRQEGMVAWRLDRWTGETVLCQAQFEGPTVCR